MSDPQPIGKEGWFIPTSGPRIRVRIHAHKGVNWLETTGVTDGRHRSISRKRFQELSHGD